MSADVRDKKFSWLKNSAACRILTNVRCLSEGVDLPNLDAGLFFSSRKSKVKMVQAVKRVMHKATGKKTDTLLFPSMNALRAPDSRMDIFVEKIKLKNSSSQISIERIDSFTAEHLNCRFF